jgi:hypothetical protein
MKGAARLGYAQVIYSAPSSLSFSLVTQLRRKYGCIIHALLSSRDGMEKKAHCCFSIPLSVFLSPYARAASNKVWQGTFSIPCLFTDALYTVCITQSNNSENSRFYLFSFTIESKKFLPFKWYRSTVLTIPKNSPLLCSSSHFRLEEQLPIKQINQLRILIDLFENWGK